MRSYVTQRPPFDLKNPWMAPIKVNRNLHSDGSDRYCMHLELDISGSRIRYDAGDHVAIYPKNDSVLVDRIGELLAIDLDTVFTMRATEYSLRNPPNHQIHDIPKTQAKKPNAAAVERTNDLHS